MKIYNVLVTCSFLILFCQLRAMIVPMEKLDNAVRERGGKLVAQLLTESQGQIIQDENGQTLLHHATDAGDLALSQALVKQGYDVNAAASNGETPLHKAAWHGWVPLVKFLLDKGAKTDSNTKSKLGPIGTPLHQAIKGGINYYDDNGKSPKNWIVITELLLKRGTDLYAKNEEEDTVLECSLEQDLIFTEMLIAYNAEVPEDLQWSNSAIVLAQDNQWDLQFAENFKSIAQMLARGAYPTPSIRIMINERSRKLFAAIALDFESTVRSLLKEGLPLSTCDKDGNTLIHKAILHRSIKCFTLLMFFGARAYFDTPNGKGQTPVDLLVATANFDLLKRTMFAGNTVADESLGNSNTKRKLIES